jgi:hypothetical protein
MYPKAKTQELLDQVAPQAIEKLGLSRFKITWRLVNGSTKTGKRMMGRRTLVGCCSVNQRKKTACITLFYNEMNGKKECKSTIIHELLHARFHIFYQHCKKNKINDMFYQEEKFVSDLERYIVANF